MKPSRRHFIHLAVGAAALPAALQIAWAQAPSAPATLSPTGKLRVALIASNPVLVTRGSDGSLSGVSVSVARTSLRVLAYRSNSSPTTILRATMKVSRVMTGTSGLLHAIQRAQNTSLLA